MATSAIEVDEKVAAMLRAQAAARQLPLSEFLQRLALSNAPLNQEPALTEDEWSGLIEQASSESPLLPNDFSRRDIYSDHD
jgi:hypothetical protein